MRNLLACAACLALSACTTELMKSDDASTAAVRTALAAQVINHGGATNPEPVTGLDGRAARQAQERYEKSFGAKESGKAYAPDMGSEK
ncbi:MAG TPA: hypothetical protein VGE60_09580 [Telluria sp.]